ncbi:MAG: radical SAM family heme chaperone HemW [Algoriphagus sp.]|nr:radical SAM family heme chaperone HemW [Algoriphagus sp.]
MAGIYIHIPFCRQACHYCDFHFSTNLKGMEEMTEALIKELELRKEYLKAEAVETVYFGGGTPSLLSVNQLESILGKIDQLFPGTKSEITLEANPDDLAQEKLAGWKSLGIDRLSLGIQSFHDQILKEYHRAHTAKESQQAIELARKAGFEKFSMDLIYGFPHEDHSLWKSDLSRALELDPGHISAYALTVEPKTVLGNWTKKGKFKPADEDFVAEQFEWLQEQTDRFGYVQYEISNFGKPGQFALHNTNYWMGSSYLGIGPSAHSFDGVDRGFNPSSNPVYVKAICSGQIPFVIEPLEPVDQINEKILTSLRTIWGLNMDLIKDQFDVDIRTEKKQEILSLEKQGWLITQGNTLSLSRKGQLLADSIASELFF